MWSQTNPHPPTWEGQPGKTLKYTRTMLTPVYIMLLNRKYAYIHTPVLDHNSQRGCVGIFAVSGRHLSVWQNACLARPPSPPHRITPASPGPPCAASSILPSPTVSRPLLRRPCCASDARSSCRVMRPLQARSHLRNSHRRDSTCARVCVWRRPSVVSSVDEKRCAASDRGVQVWTQ